MLGLSVVKITGIISPDITFYPKMGWSTSPEQVVKMVRNIHIVVVDCVLDNLYPLATTFSQFKKPLQDAFLSLLLARMTGVLHLVCLRKFRFLASFLNVI